MQVNKVYYSNDVNKNDNSMTLILLLKNPYFLRRD